MNNEFEFYVEDEEESFEFYENFSNNKQLNDELVEACGFKKLLPMKVQEGINEGVLGLPAMKYKKLHGIKEPFNDNLTKDQVDTKNIGIILATMRIRKHEKPELTHKEGKHIGLTSGQYAKRITLEAVHSS